MHATGAGDREVEPRRELMFTFEKLVHGCFTNAYFPRVLLSASSIDGSDDDPACGRSACLSMAVIPVTIRFTCSAFSSVRVPLGCAARLRISRQILTLFCSSSRTPGFSREASSSTTAASIVAADNASDRRQSSASCKTLNKTSCLERTRAASMCRLIHLESQLKP